jgi:hypothetical protein
VQRWGFREGFGIETGCGLGVGFVREMAVESNRGFLGNPWQTIKLSLMDWMARTRFMM